MDDSSEIQQLSTWGAVWPGLRVVLGFALAGGLAISFFFLYVDLKGAIFGGNFNPEFCSLRPGSVARILISGEYTCYVQLDYAVFTFLFFPVCIVFWQAVFAGVLFAGVAISRQFQRFLPGGVTGRDVRIERNFPPIAVGSTIYVIGALSLGGLRYAVDRSRYEGDPDAGLSGLFQYLPPVAMFEGFLWLYILAPVPVYLLYRYLREAARSRS